MRKATLFKVLLFVLLIPLAAYAAIISRVTNFSDGQVLTAAQLNAEFNNAVDGVNNIDNANISSGANISASKIAAAIAGSGLERDGSTGVLSVSVDDVGIEIDGNTLQLKDDGVTTAKIDDDAVTTAKILNANVTTAKIADGNVTPAKLSASNTVVSASDSGAFSTASTSTAGVAVTNLSVSITTTGRPVEITMKSNSTTSYDIPGLEASGSLTGFIFFYRDATMLSVETASQGETSPCSSVSFIETPAAGTYTYTVRAGLFLGSGTMNVRECNLVAREL